MMRFRMFRINVEQFAILAENVQFEKLDIATGLEIKYSLEGKSLAIVMTFNFVSEEEKVMLLKLNCEFQIQEDDWNSQINDAKIIFPKNFIEYLVVQTVGTARGVLHCKTEGTAFNHIILPPMNVSDMINGDMIVNL
ncbi:MAG: hypothetical protein IKA75_09585 [Bacteroidaceae bacterium]|nr:hypothetical protein [Bacteroidaceae bacterium]